MNVLKSGNSSGKLMMTTSREYTVLSLQMPQFYSGVKTFPFLLSPCSKKFDYRASHVEAR